jgi:hypothetical protein
MAEVWYDVGGELHPGWATVRNDTGSPELILMVDDPCPEPKPPAPDA